MGNRIHGYADGDRVRDRRDGSIGTVRHLDLTDEERASGECAEAEIVWDGLAVQDELELALPHIERVK
ncbi:hypothetical protein [Amycolatopsis pigmentata]|uniref:DUF2171 domain-containing protein n=1 Tax=Amycolatopsis pigmentata TaxID=450801 RepID=A0ABW5G6I9_9PSEU